MSYVPREIHTRQPFLLIKLVIVTLSVYGNSTYTTPDILIYNIC